MARKSGLALGLVGSGERRSCVSFIGGDEWIDEDR